MASFRYQQSDGEKKIVPKTEAIKTAGVYIPPSRYLKSKISDTYFCTILSGRDGCMGKLSRGLILSFICCIIFACDNNHQSEFYRIQRDDVAGYQEFIRKYPQSIYVTDALERIQMVKEERKLQNERQKKEAELRQLESLYGDNSLINGAQPYSRWYGNNLRFDEYTPHSEIQIKAPYNSDVIAIVRYNNMNGKVAGHCYIKAGMTSTIYLGNGFNYQTFFYYGKGWYPSKEMKNVRGGFIKDEAFSKDGSSSYLENNILSYELTLQANGNFQTSESNEDEMF